jgi:cytochrome c553
VLLVVTSSVAGPLDGPGAQKALVCSACHGFAGNSRGDTVPILAGVDVAYFKKAIADYAAGRRPSPEMEPYAKMVVQSGVDDVAAYFAGQTRQPTPIGADPAAVPRGRVAAAACGVCHGANGKGDKAKLIPDLTGQPPGFLRNQLLLFKQDQRSPGDAELKAVKALIRTLPDETLTDLAAYYSTLR